MTHPPHLSSQRSPEPRRYLRRARLSVGVSLTLLLPVLVGCGGGGSTPTTAPPEDTEPAPLLDFSAIAGTWTGTAVEGSGVSFFIAATIESSATRGEEAGRVEYRVDEDGGPDCENIWLAADAEHPVFVFNEVLGAGSTCPPGTVTLELFGSELSYQYTPDSGNENFAASGTLTRE